MTPPRKTAETTKRQRIEHPFVETMSVAPMARNSSAILPRPPQLSKLERFNRSSRSLRNTREATFNTRGWPVQACLAGNLIRRRARACNHCEYKPPQARGVERRHSIAQRVSRWEMRDGSPAGARSGRKPASLMALSLAMHAVHRRDLRHKPYTGGPGGAPEGRSLGKFC
jgi:hypothetical protein